MPDKILTQCVAKAEQFVRVIDVTNHVAKAEQFVRVIDVRGITFYNQVIVWLNSHDIYSLLLQWLTMGLWTMRTKSKLLDRR